ncbi:MAG: aminotransferase class IV [Bacteroidota bacterium]
MQNHTPETICFNFQFLPGSELILRQSTQSTIVYEVVRLINGVPLFWEGHWQRLLNSLNAIQSEIILDKTKLESFILLYINNQKLYNTNIRIEIFDDNILFYNIQAEYPNENQYTNGVHVNFICAIRENPTQKILRREWKKAMETQIKAEGVYESLLVNQENLITEGSHTNLFFIKNNTLFSADESLILHGITRMEVLRIARQNKIPLIYQALHKDKIAQFDAAFLCATSLHILPISKINDCNYDVNNNLLRTLMIDFMENINNEILGSSKKWGK